MSRNYTPEFKKKIVRLYEEEGRTYKSITAEYGVSKASISKWCSEFSKECQQQANTNQGEPTKLDMMKENLRLRRELEEMKKENLFLKKQRHSLQRNSIRGVSVPGPVSGRIWYPVATETAWDLPQRLLQLSQTAQSGVCC